ncbi:hypothetical protein ANN_17749 [Periplaneta americana]|uniref:Uncharacterized protein n=1 Tax=Periplaneta americana TaxID=6978 RepID=A0ABQ8STU7_PERAM|nr:hypothetical protein ANN_17749 [Periplaneta americana]
MIVNDKKKHTDEGFLKEDNKKFEKVDSFVYLGSLMNNTNEIKEDINMRIKPVLTYEANTSTWVLCVGNMARFRVFERKILRKFYGPTNENGDWRIRYDRELYQLYDFSDIITD